MTKEQLLDHIRAVGPVSLYSILGWLGDQSNLKTAQQVGLWATLCREGAIELYEPDDATLGYVAADPGPAR